ncbi:hypothetical protein [Rhodocaloribacter sp.]
MTQNQLERRVRFLTAYACGLTLLLIVPALSAFGPTRSMEPDRLEANLAEADTVVANVVVANRIEVVDRGVVRVRIGGQLPDAGPVPRGGVPAGVLLYDSTGQERGGYVTFDSGNVILTLDGRRSQSAFFVADTTGETALRIWYGKNLIDLRADKDGARITAVQDGHVVFQQPEIADPESSHICAALRELRGQVDDARLLAVCRERMSDAACRACLEQP